MNATHWWKFTSFVLVLLFAPPAHSADFYSEGLRIPMAAAGARGLEAFLMRPAASGQYPLALISHGTPRNVDDRAGMTAQGYRAIAYEFARRGFAALAVLRRGYGTSPGGLVDSYGSCSRPDYRDALAVSVADLKAAIAAMGKRSDVTTRGMIAIGHSAGGLATVGLTAQAPPGLAAAISFAGGRGSARAGMVCGDKPLVDLFRQLGTTSRVPMLWVYAKNDGFFPPDLAHRFRDAFAGSGGKVTFIDAPRFGKDGHFLFSGSSAATWTPYVDDFLHAQNLQYQISVDALPVPPQLGANGKDAFAQYLGHAPHKAFAVAPDGSFGWRSSRRTAADAEREALEACTRNATRCSIYAVDDALSR
ncbi:MAG TPA: alpha/beta hydrolase [Bradyrhizobium sp.]|uniref:alpha/beta hydrolase family protein n=1 Tax=Bradyrhizobium sp. TaxID=376 RepID=UPI002C4C0E9C|nr:alpha/beta hydrolase [Bradyrhizobium sp.]HLZ02698.1 alpha/beta hydrolase [Bradyrhizobium sp.]